MSELQPPEPPEPSPDRFVTVLLEELTRAENRAAAAEALYPRLAARMRSSVGGIKDLDRILGNTLFAPLLAGRHTDQHPADRLGDAARVRVLIGDSGGERAPYLFSLALRADADGSPAWRVTGLVREDAL